MVAFIVIWIFMSILGLSAVAALVWAIYTGQFRNLASGAESIFDEDEPIGKITDHFPSRE